MSRPPLSPSDLEKIAQIVREETGNQVKEKNHSMLESRMTTHLLKLGIPNMQEYWSYFAAHEADERETLKGLFTTHYTFFFREYAHFEVLQKWIEDNVAVLKKRGTPVKVWCAAASRGQEPYSLAMFLEVNLLKKHGVGYEVIGTDIDPESISYGKNGVYPLKEVGTIPQDYLQAFWKKGSGAVKDFAAIVPNIKTRVKLDTLNLLEVPAWKSTDSFDVIFCRNVFIYFSEDDVKKIAGFLAKRLAPDGLFVSGVSEPLRFKEWTMPVVGPSAYRNTKSLPAASSPTLTADSTSGAPAVVASGKKYKVLTVDDSGTIQALMKKIFSQDPDCEKIVSAVNGKDAREKLDKEKFDLITLDIHMPEVNGIEFMERLYRRKSDPPVIMVSSVSRQDVDLATKSMTLGAFDYVEKPAMNNLQKSTSEILTKAKMAIRSRNAEAIAADPQAGAFDASIAQKIVVPDASQCLRVVRATDMSLNLLQTVIDGQSKESRSPALVVVYKNAEQISGVIQKSLSWTNRTVEHLRESKGMLRPNHIYFISDIEASPVLSKVEVKRLSLQILDNSDFNWTCVKHIPSIQVLIDETQSALKNIFELNQRMAVSDITPSTSFPSLSLEYFANFRKAA